MKVLRLINPEVPRMQIPAVCVHCGLVTGSGIGFSAESYGRVDIMDSISTCPRCAHISHILDGYFDIQKGLVRLIDGPEFSRHILDAMAKAVDDVAKTRKTQAQAISAVEKVDRNAAKTLREWLAIGVGLAGLLVATATAVFDYSQARGNRDLMIKALETFQTVMETRLQYDGRATHVSPLYKLSLGTYPPKSTIQKPASPNAEEQSGPQNRKARRAEAARVRPKSRPKPKS